MLESFARRNFFIERHAGPVTTYRYHSLFRDFLRLYLARTVAPEAMRNLYRRAAATLFESGSMHEAVRLYSLARDGNGLAEAILTCAPRMIARGEHRTVQEWLRLLPRSMGDQKPMLIFYEGLSRLPITPPEARCHFTRALAKFGQRNDLEGCLLSWSGIVETFYIARDGTLELADWIREGERLSGLLPSDPDSPMRVRFAQGMLMALTLAAPGGAQTGVWLQRCSRLLLHCPDRDLRLRLANTMAIATCVRGETHDAAIILEHLRSRPPSADSPVADRIVFHLAECLYCVLTGRNEKCVSEVEEALALGSQWGVNVFDCLLYALSAHAALASGNMHSARANLEKIAVRLPRAAAFDLAHYYSLSAWEAYALGNPRRALTLSKKGRRFAIGSGWLPATLASNVLHARLLAESRRWQASESLIATAVQQSRTLDLVVAEFHALLALAELRMLQGAFDEMREPLRGAFAISRAKGVMAAPWTLRNRLSELCQRALQFGIEEDQVRRFIRRHRLLPPPVVVGPEWPFAVRVRILGQRSVLCDPKPIALADKAPPKLLELLDLLVCRGPGGIGRQAAAERLWPEADGDCAQQNMSTALHRLKKLLCHEQAIEIRNGRLALSPQYCWIDAWHFESLLERAEAARDMAAKESMLKAAVSIYDRPIAEASAASVLWFPYAERLEKKYQRARSDLQRLMATAQWRKIGCSAPGAERSCRLAGGEGYRCA